MKDKIFKNKIDKSEPGYILAFTLVVVAVLLLVSISISRIIAKEMYFSRLVDNNRVAYFAADSGLECAQYLDSNLRDNGTSISIILNSLNSQNGKYEFEQNLMNNVFGSTSTVFINNSGFIVNDTLNNYLDKIYCATNGAGNFNKIFLSANYASSSAVVKNNLNNLQSSYNVVGDASHATTTFGFILKQQNIKGDDIYRCVLVEYAKTRLTATLDTNITSYFSINSTGYSSCNSSDSSRVSRTINRYSTE